MFTNKLTSFFSNYYKTLTSIFCFFLGAFIINLRFEISNCILLWDLFNSLFILFYSSILILLLSIYIIMHLFQYKEYYKSRKTYLLSSNILYQLLQGSFVIIDLQKAIIAAKPLNISPKLKNFHEIFFHERAFSRLQENYIYIASQDKRGYDALAFPSTEANAVLQGNIDSISLYEFKKFSNANQLTYNRLALDYSEPFKLSEPIDLNGFRPKSVDFIDVGFLKGKHFEMAIDCISKPEKVSFIDLSLNFDRLEINNINGSLDKNTILTKESLERLGIFIEKYTSSENMEIAKELNELTSPGGSLYGLL